MNMFQIKVKTINFCEYEITDDICIMKQNDAICKAMQI